MPPVVSSFSQSNNDGVLAYLPSARGGCSTHPSTRVVETFAENVMVFT